MASPVTQSDLEEIFRIRHDDFDRLGRAPRMRLRFNYYSPDECYEAVVNKLGTSNGSWPDVGCGRNIFPSNIRLADILSNAACSETNIYFTREYKSVRMH